MGGVRSLVVAHPAGQAVPEHSSRRLPGARRGGCGGRDVSVVELPRSPGAFRERNAHCCNVFRRRRRKEVLITVQPVPRLLPGFDGGGRPHPVPDLDGTGPVGTRPEQQRTGRSRSASIARPDRGLPPGGYPPMERPLPGCSPPIPPCPSAGAPPKTSGQRRWSGQPRQGFQCLAAVAHRPAEDIVPLQELPAGPAGPPAWNQ